MVTCLHNKAEDQDSWSFARISQNKKKNLFHELHGSLGSKRSPKTRSQVQEPFVQQNWGVVYFDLLFLLFSFTLPAGEQDRHHLGICNLAQSDNQMWHYPWQVLWNALEICCSRSNMVWDSLGCFGVASFQEIPTSSIILGESKSNGWNTRPFFFTNRCKLTRPKDHAKSQQSIPMGLNSEGTSWFFSPNLWFVMNSELPFVMFYIYRFYSDAYSHACGGTHPKSQGEMGHGRRRLVRSCHGTRGFISSQLCFGRTQWIFHPASQAVGDLARWHGDDCCSFGMFWDDWYFLYPVGIPYCT